MNAAASRWTTLALLLLAAVSPAQSGAVGTESDRNDSTVVIVGEDGEQVTLTLANGQLTIVADEDGRRSTSIIDMDAMGLLAADAVEGALGGLEDVIAELGKMQFQYRAGRDNRLNFSYDDTEFELDLDAVMAEVANAVQVGLSEINTAEWTSHRSGWDAVSDDELRDQLNTLKDEMKELRRELERLRAEKKER